MSLFDIVINLMKALKVTFLSSIYVMDIRI